MLKNFSTFFTPCSVRLTILSFSLTMKSPVSIGDGAGIVQVLKDPSGVSVSSPYVVWLHLYDIFLNTVTADHRAQSLVNLQLFHA